MKDTLMHFTFFAAVALLNGVCSYCQQLQPHLELSVASAEYAIAQYETFIEGQQIFLNGSAYNEPKRTGESHPFFGTEEWQLGSLVFENQLYSNVLLLYDIYSDRLVTETSNGQLIAICPEKLSSFKINNRHFIRIENAQVKNSLPASGNYELLYPGVTRVIAIRSKQREEIVAQREVDIRFNDVNRCYVFKNGRFHSIKSKRALLNLLHEQKNTLRSFIQKNNVRFSGDKAHAIALVTAFYDSLIQR